jgi:hypothetical protein
MLCDLFLYFQHYRRWGMTWHLRMIQWEHDFKHPIQSDVATWNECKLDETAVSLVERDVHTSIKTVVQRMDAHEAALREQLNDQVVQQPQRVCIKLVDSSRLLVAQNELRHASSDREWATRQQDIERYVQQHVYGLLQRIDRWLRAQDVVDEPNADDSKINQVWFYIQDRPEWLTANQHLLQLRECFPASLTLQSYIQLYQLHMRMMPGYEQRLRLQRTEHWLMRRTRHAMVRCGRNIKSILLQYGGQSIVNTHTAPPSPVNAKRRQRDASTDVCLVAKKMRYSAV